MKLICKTKGCGNELFDYPDTGLLIIALTFPKDLLLIGNALKYGSDSFYCQQCEQFHKYDAPIVLVSHIKKKNVFVIFVSVFIRNIDPEIEAKISVQLKTKKLLTNQKIVFCYSPDVFRQEFRIIIKEPALTILNEYSQFSTAAKKMDFINGRLSELDASFFGTIWLYLSGFLSMNIAIQTPKDEIPWSDEQMKDEVLRFCTDIFLELKAMRFISFVDRLIKKNNITTLLKSVQAIYPSITVDKELINFVTDSLREILKTHPDIYAEYSILSSIAALCLHGSEVNQLENDWVRLYVSFRIHQAELPAGFNFVTTDFAQKTINYEALSIFISSLFRSRELTEDGYEVVKQVCNDLGYSNLVNTIKMNTRIDFGLDISSADLFDKVSEIVSSNETPDVKLLIVLSALQHLIKSHATSLANKLLDLYLSNNNSKNAIQENVYIMCRVAEFLNNSHHSGMAELQLKACREYVSQHSSLSGLPFLAEMDLLTEEGNVMRSFGLPADALKKYEEIDRILTANDIDIDDSDFRINELNKAIMYREMGKYGISIGILLYTIDHAKEHEKILLLNTLGGCHIELGNHQAAYEYLNTAYNLCKNETHTGSTKFRIYISLLQTCILLKRYDQAREILTMALSDPLIKYESHLIFLFTFNAIYHNNDLCLFEPQELKIKLNEAIRIGYSLGESPAFNDNPANIRYAIVVQLVELLIMAGDVNRAKSLIYKALEEYDQIYRNRWKLIFKLAQIAFKEDDFDSGLAFLFNAYRELIEELKISTISQEQIYFMKDKEVLHQHMTYYLYNAFLSGNIDSLTFLFGIDLQNSLLLLSNVIKRTPDKNKGLFSNLDNNSNFIEKFTDNIKYLYQTGNCEQLVVLHSIDLEEKYKFLFTLVSREGIDCRVLEWEVGTETLSGIKSRLYSLLNNWNPVKKENPLDLISEYETFSNGLKTELLTMIPENAQVCIILNGEMTNMPIHTLFDGRFKVNYSPSIHALITQREMKITGIGGSGSKPQKISLFTVWRTDDTVKVAETMQLSALQLPKTLFNKHREITSYIGTSATRENLVEALKDSQMLKISCHGLADTQNYTFSLLVSNGRQLPPNDISIYHSTRIKEYLFDWNAISDLQTCPALVFSTACSSGSAVTGQGNELIGFSRFFFSGGGLSYIAPLWDVTAEIIQPLVDEVITCYLDGSKVSLSEALYITLKRYHIEGAPLWVLQSVTLQGDWI